MGTMEFWKCEPDKFLVGVRGLSLEETGAYSIILQLIYSTDNQLMDDDFEMCGSLHCNARVWKRIKDKLIAKGKIYVENGFLMNSKATSTILNVLQNSAKVSELNRLKGVKSGIARRKNKGLTEPTVEPIVEPQANHIRDKKEEIRDKKEDRGELPLQEPSQSVALPKPAKPQSKGTRLPDDWFPEPLSKNFLKENPFTPEALNREFQKFRNYWLAKPGGGAIKLDWNATWRNWLLNNYSGNQNGKTKSETNRTPTVQEIIAGFDAEIARSEQDGDARTDGLFPDES